MCYLCKPMLGVKLNHPMAKMPEYKTLGSSGMDVRSIEEYRLQPGEIKGISTGLSFCIPEGYEIQVRPRSGLAIKNGITILNTPGTCDQDYTGTVICIMINHGKEEFHISIGDRIAQLVLCKVSQAELKEVNELDETERGSSGFGSTGVK